MEFEQVVRQRRMVRNYDPNRQPSPTTVTDLLSLASRAPSAGFSQGWHFLVLADQPARDVFWNATADPKSKPDSWLSGMRSAPVLVVALSEPQTYLNRYAEDDKGWTDRATDHWPVPYWDVDTGMASLLILLGAVDRGLAGCFFGVPVPRLDAVRQALAIPPALNVVGVISLGYPLADRRSPSLARGRRPLGEITSYGRYGISPPPGVSRETPPT